MKLPKPLSILTLAVFLLMSGIILWGVPPNMDEFSFYHALACWTSPLGTVIEGVREPCSQAYDLKIAGHWLPIRSFPYLGSASSFFYWPMYSVWPSYLSARISGFLSVLVFVAGLIIWTGARPLLVLALFGCSFPVLYQMIADTGPVAFQLSLLAWTPVLFRWATQASRLYQRVLVSIALGLLLFLAIETKPFFLLILPAVAASALLIPGVLAKPEPLRKDINWRRLTLATSVVLLILVPLLALLFTAELRTGEIYFQKLATEANSVQFIPPGPLGWFGNLMTWVAVYFFNILNFAHRVYDRFSWSEAWITGIFWIFITVFLRSAIRSGWLKKPGRAYWVKVALACELLVILAVSRNANAQRGHHFVFWVPFLLLVFLSAFDWMESHKAKAARGGLAVYLILNLAFVARVVARTPAHHSEWSRLDALQSAQALHKRSPQVVVHLDWGTYYLHALYGPRDRLILYIDPLLERSALEAVEGLAQRFKRGITWIKADRSSARWELMQRRFGPALQPVQFNPSPTESHWQIWSVPLESLKKTEATEQSPSAASVSSSDGTAAASLESYLYQQGWRSALTFAFGPCPS